VDCNPAKGAIPLENLADMHAGSDPNAEFGRRCTL
jgi:hypothetical protein